MTITDCLRKSGRGSSRSYRNISSSESMRIELRRLRNENSSGQWSCLSRELPFRFLYDRDQIHGAPETEWRLVDRLGRRFPELTLRSERRKSCLLRSERRCARRSISTERMHARRQTQPPWQFLYEQILSEPPSSGGQQTPTWPFTFTDALRNPSAPLGLISTTSRSRGQGLDITHRNGLIAARRFGMRGG